MDRRTIAALQSAFKNKGSVTVSPDFAVSSTVTQ
jgi:hypothetical protein